MRNHPLGIYEKALAKDLSWPERLVLAKSCGFDFVEMSVDETDERLSRLDWSAAQRTSLVAAMIETVPVCPSSFSLWQPGRGSARTGAGNHE